MALSRRRFLRNLSMTGAAIRVGLPPLAAMFNMNGTAYAAAKAGAPVRSRFLFWFNGNGIPERYWIPREFFWPAGRRTDPPRFHPGPG